MFLADDCSEMENILSLCSVDRLLKLSDSFFDRDTMSTLMNPLALIVTQDPSRTGRTKKRYPTCTKGRPRILTKTSYSTR
ncbi:hypothetical protein ABKN59_005638 [Abortiporus biennis]